MNLHDLQLDKLVLIIIGGMLGIIFASAIGLRRSLSGLFISKNGVKIITNTLPIYFEITGKLERIDSSTKKAIRKATVGMSIADTAVHGFSQDICMINHAATLPLIYAAYENHHTRELSDSGASSYIKEKAYDVREAVKLWRAEMPWLDNGLVNAYIGLWIQEAVVPHVTHACKEKIAYYKSMLERQDIVESMQDLLKTWIEKNEKYLKSLEELEKQSDNYLQSSITGGGETTNKGDES